MRSLWTIVFSLAALGCGRPQSLEPPAEPPKAELPYVDEAIYRRPLSDGSLWQDRPLAADRRAHRLNDLVTIRIRENTAAKVKGDASTSRSGANSYNATSFLAQVGTLGVDGSDLASGGASGSSSASSASGSSQASAKDSGTGLPATTTTKSTYKGSGTTDRSADITTTITARVVRVLSNGNLIVEGFRDIQLNRETQRLYVAGMVDPLSLDADNSVSSSQVAELKVAYGGKGVVDETTRPGHGTRVLNQVWPF